MLEGATRPAAISLPRAVALRWLSLALLLVGELLAITTWLDTTTHSSKFYRVKVLP